jgi:hypothetical protein
MNSSYILYKNLRLQKMSLIQDVVYKSKNRSEHKGISLTSYCNTSLGSRNGIYLLWPLSSFITNMLSLSSTIFPLSLFLSIFSSFIPSLNMTSAGSIRIFILWSITPLYRAGSSWLLRK